MDNYYIIITDINSRQYIFQITDLGIEITSDTTTFTITKDNPQLDLFNPLIANEATFTVNNKSDTKMMFNGKKLVNVEFKVLHDDAY